jgi:hypothetical protein
MNFPSRYRVTQNDLDPVGVTRKRRPGKTLSANSSLFPDLEAIAMMAALVNLMVSNLPSRNPGDMPGIFQIGNIG